MRLFVYDVSVSYLFIVMLNSAATVLEVMMIFRTRPCSQAVGINTTPSQIMGTPCKELVLAFTLG